MKAPFTYYGGKGQLAKWIASLLPPHRVYVEPFCGSAAVLFAKEPSTHEIINDLNGDVVAFFRVLRERPDELERACRLTPYSRAEFAAADLTDRSIDELERARRFWVKVNQSFANSVGKGTGWSTSIKRRSNNARSAANRIDRFERAAARLLSVTIENRDALEIIAEYSAADGVIYVDPPYLDETRTAFGGGRRPAGDYPCEFATAEQHTQLAEALNQSPATVFVSGYPSPLYDELFAGWQRIDRRVLRRTTNGRGGSTTHVTEALWTNRHLDEGRLFAVAGASHAITHEGD